MSGGRPDAPFAVRWHLNSMLVWVFPFRMSFRSNLAREFLNGNGDRRAQCKMAGFASLIILS
jgi:hypothetical protein